MKSFIETYTGEVFDPLHPKEAAVNIDDIAHALSNQCRFSGHCLWHYSVAQHSFLVSTLLARWDASPLVQMIGLLHDASEAYLVDLPTPLKKHRFFGQSYRAAERPLQKAICNHFSLPTKQPALVDKADAVLLATEVKYLMRSDREYWQKLKEKPDPETVIERWAPEYAKRMFLDLFHNIGT